MSRENKWSLVRTENYNIKDVKEAIGYAVEELTEHSYYAPLVERFPVLIDEQVPRKQMDILRKNDAPMCTDSNNVYVSSELLIKTLNEAKDEAKKVGGDYELGMVPNIASILAHEYTHILCQHVRIGRELGRKRITRMEQTCHVIACEIEANRGDMVKNYRDDYRYRWCAENATWTIAVTDDRFPETKKDKYYPQIYATLLKMYKERQQLMEQLMQMVSDLFASDEAEGDGTEGENGSSLKKAKETKDGSGGSGKDKKDGKDGKKGGGVSMKMKGDKSEEGEKSNPEDFGLTQEQIEQSIKDAMEVTNKIAEEGKGVDAGYGLESPYIEYVPGEEPQEMLKRDYERWHRDEVKRELKKLKGLIKGTVSKNREKTYARPTRRPISTGTLIRKGVRYEKSYSPKVLIAMDSSGSMHSTTMKEVACAIENIFKDLGKPKQGSYICKHESYVTGTKPMFRWKEVVESYRPSGGNCFAHVVEEANKLGVDVVLNIGDGQDTITRGGYSEKCVNEFNNAGRKWFDVLVTNKGENQTWRDEAEYDENNGFHRDAIFLGDEITKYLK